MAVNGKASRILADVRTLLAIIGIGIAGVLWLIRSETRAAVSAANEPLVEAMVQTVEHINNHPEIHTPVNLLMTRTAHRERETEMKEWTQLKIDESLGEVKEELVEQRVLLEQIASR
jgi:hypothetical protein